MASASTRSQKTHKQIAQHLHLASLCRSERERWQEWATPMVHTTQQPLIYFSLLFFPFDCAYEHVWHLWERKSDSAYMGAAEALPPSLLCIAAQTANHRVTSATQKETNSQPWSLTFRFCSIHCQLWMRDFSCFARSYVQDWDATFLPRQR